LRLLKGHDGRITVLDTIADGRVVTGSRDGTLMIWDIETGAGKRLNGRSGEITSWVALRNGWAVSAGLDSVLRLWNVDPDSPAYCEEMSQFCGDAPITCMVSAAENGLLLAGDSTGGIHWFEVRL